VVTLGVLKETKIAERRVALVPEDVRRLHDAGARVVVEADAGRASNFDDELYCEAGAEIVASMQALIAESDVVIKVKEPTPPEIARLQPGQVFMSFLHLAAFPQLVTPLVRSGATAIGYETISIDGQHPVLRPMSEVAGALSLQIGEHYLEATSGGRGVLLPGIDGKDPGKVVIIGSGIVGEACGRLAYGEGIRVVFVDANPARLAGLSKLYPKARLLGPDPKQLSIELEDADLLVGAVYVTGARAPRVISREQIARLPRRSVAVDVAIDQGGCFETSRPTTHESPIFEDAGVVHYCVTNIPAKVPHSASVALSHALLPYVLTIARQGTQDALAHDEALSNAVNIRSGAVALDSIHGLTAA
jgi:alanine dehydrogenase